MKERDPPAAGRSACMQQLPACCLGGLLEQLQNRLLKES